MGFPGMFPHLYQPAPTRRQLEDEVSACCDRMTADERVAEYVRLLAAGMTTSLALATIARHDRKDVTDDVRDALTYHVLRTRYGCQRR